MIRATRPRANDPEEAVYPNTTLDVDGEPLDGSRRYSIMFARDQLPDVDAFWSLTVYGTDYCLVDNPIDRYSIGNRTPGLQYDDDGGLTLHLQATSPGPQRESNWLPLGHEGEAMLVLRCYLPGPDILNLDWQIPPVVRVD